MKVIEHVWTWRQGRVSSDKDSAAAARSGYELALHLWGSLLFEMQAGCERIRWMAEEDQLAFGTFDFSVSDALMPDFCRLVPSPALLSQFQSVLAALSALISTSGLVVKPLRLRSPRVTGQRSSSRMPADTDAPWLSQRMRCRRICWGDSIGW